MCTIIFALIISRSFGAWDYLICPAKDLQTSAWTLNSCDPNPVFIPVKYHLSPALNSLCRHVLRQEVKYLKIAPIQIHALIMAFFASIIAPFGGFFASGFKRAFKLKDFGDSIPYVLCAYNILIIT